MDEQIVELPPALVEQTGAATMRIRAMRRGELDELIGWAADEGWNPGRDDAEVFWATDPEGFVAADIDGELVGGGSIVAYGTTYGFMGLFIVRTDVRHEGLGRVLWHARRDLLRRRLDPGAPIEMDGVFAMQHFYAAGGFAFQHRDLRFEGRLADPPSPAVPVVDLADVPFDAVDAYDRAHVAAPRSGFLRRWIDRPGGHALGVLGGDGLAGMAVSRPCGVGHKVGPLFADDAATAEALLLAIAGRLGGEPMAVDAPECNPAAIELVHRHGMTEVFGCARMTLGPAPAVPWDQVFGVTTFELG